MFRAKKCQLVDPRRHTHAGMLYLLVLQTFTSLVARDAQLQGVVIPGEGGRGAREIRVVHSLLAAERAARRHRWVRNGIVDLRPRDFCDDSGCM